MKKCLYFALLLLFVSIILTGCKGVADESKVITTQKFSNGTTVTLMNGTGKFKEGDNNFVVLFKDSSGQPTDIGNVAATINMPAMGQMQPMSATVQLSSISTGKYQAKLDIEMKGAWTMTIQTAGKTGDGKVAFTINAE